MNFTNICKCSAPWHNIKVKRFSKKNIQVYDNYFFKRDEI